jgi:hypothetical protein
MQTRLYDAFESNLGSCYVYLTTLGLHHPA